MAQYIEDYLPPIQSAGLNTLEDTSLGGDLVVAGEATFTGGITGTEQVVTAVSNGTTAVSVFGASGLGYAIDITGVFLIARDTTATNITVEAPASTTVCTIAKGTSAGALVGATSLANNTGIPAGTDVVIDGSGAGVAQVFITFKRAA